MTIKLKRLSSAGAVFVDDRRHRLYLWRKWADGPEIMFIGLNPSTAGETEDDPTVRRCIGFAKRWGYGTMFMCNAFSLVSTDASVLKGRSISQLLDRASNLALRTVRKRCKKAVVAWGNGVDSTWIGAEREKSLVRMLGPVHCFGRTKLGHPKHPLYLKNDAKLSRFQEPA